AAIRLDSLDRRGKRVRAGRNNCPAERDVLPTPDPDRVWVGEGPQAPPPIPPVGLKGAFAAPPPLPRNAPLPHVRCREVELRLSYLDAELREVLLGFLERERCLHPCLRRDAADAQARAAELGLPFDAGDLRAELCGADGGGVAARAASEDGDVNV